VLLENEVIRAGKKRSPTTVRHYLISLSHLFTIAVRDWEWLQENPMDKVSKPKPTRGRQRYLSEDERNALIAEAKKSQCPFLYPIVVLALSTGMRRGEIMNLKISDIDLKHQRIDLKASKNDEPRAIPLKGLALKLISDIWEERRCLKLSELLFPSPTNPAKPYDIETSWQSALKRANIQDFRFHDNRHSNASIHASQGRSLLEICQSLGHKSQQTTKRYAHLAYEHTAKMAEELDKEIFGENL